MPWYVTTFLKLVSPFIDPVTKTKMRYNEPLTDHIPASQLMKHANGEVDFEYNHEIYWPALDKLATERRQERKERWEKAGKLVGESEIYLWGGEEQSVGAKEAKPEAETAKDVPVQNGAVTEGEKNAEASKAEEVKSTAVPVPESTSDEKKAEDVADRVAKLGVKDAQEPAKVAAA